MTPAPSLDVRGPSPASPGGAPLAPRPRRVDYLLAAAVGVAAAPATMVLLGTASSLAAADRLPLAVLHLALALTVCAAAQWFFAVRSSLGGLAAGLVALVAQVAVLLSPQGSQSAPTPWARTFIPTGTLLIDLAITSFRTWMSGSHRGGPPRPPPQYGSELCLYTVPPACFVVSPASPSRAGLARPLS